MLSTEKASLNKTSVNIGCAGIQLTPTSTSNSKIIIIIIKKCNTFLDIMTAVCLLCYLTMFSHNLYITGTDTERTI